MNNLERSFFIPNKTTHEHIDDLSNPKNKLSEIEVANLIVKFTVDYICGFLKIRDYHQPYSLDFLNDILFETQKNIKNTSQQNRILSLTNPDLSPNKYIKKAVNDISYQVLMLIDFSKTLAVFLDIAGRNIKKKDDKYYGLDLGTGSGILLLAQYIQAKRNGFTDENITNIGIELNKRASEVSNILAHNLGFGNVVYGDTTSTNIIKSLQIPRIDFLSNENLPFPRSYLFYEPFTKNLENLIKCGFDLSETEFFPSGVLINGIFCDKKFDFKDKEDILNFIKNTQKDRSVKIETIYLNGEKIDLSVIGKKYILKFGKDEGIFTIDLGIPPRW